jgi:hypothetical protein
MSMAELKATKPVKWWHEAIIDDMLLYPLDTLEVRGKRLGYSGNYLSIIINTDMFRAVYEQRRNEFKHNMDNALTQKASSLALKGLDIMLETLETKRTQIPFAVLSDSVDKTLTRLGYGVPTKGPTVQVIGNNAQVAVLPTVTAEQLLSAREALRAVENNLAIEPPERAKRADANRPPLDGILDLTPEPGDS